MSNQKQKGSKNMKKRIVVAILAAAAVAAAAGCGAKQSGEKSGDDNSVRWWVTSAVKEGDHFAEFLEEKTGVKVNWEFPSDSGNSSTAFNLMIASDDLPDIIQTGWANSHGGPDQNIEKKVIEDLTPYMDGGKMPNLKKYLDEHPDLKQYMTSAENKYYYFPQILGDERLASFRTWFIREDLLQKAGLEKPETLEEWDKVMHAFVDMGIKTPMMAKFTGWQFRSDSPFGACFNTPASFYHDGKTVKYGMIEEGFGDWVKQMAKWYADGILDKNFLDETNEHWSAEIINGNNGAFLGSIGGNLGTYTDAIDPSTGIKYVPCTIPTAVKGERAMWSSKDFLVKAVGAAVSASSSKKDTAVKLLDFGYSEEGQLLWNFGKEGVSYEMKANEEGRMIPTYTDIIMDPAKRDGKTQGDVMGLYTRVGMPISVQSIDYLYQNYKYQTQKDAIDLACSARTEDYALPTGICTSDQEKQLADIVTPMDTYREETICKIIAGKLPIETLDEYFAKMKEMGAEKAIEIYQTAYDKFLEKK